MNHTSNSSTDVSLEFITQALSKTKSKYEQERRNPMDTMAAGKNLDAYQRTELCNQSNYQLSSFSLISTPFDKTSELIFSILLIPMSVVGMAANALIIYIILSSKKLKSSFNHLLVSLCASDFLSAAISPLFLYKMTWGLYSWKASRFLCKILWGVDRATSVATSLHILCYSLFRLISVLFPHRFKHIPISHAKACAIMSWVVAMGCAFVPCVIWSDVTEYKRLGAEGFCSIPPHWRRQFDTYSIAGNPVFFYAPSILITMFSAATIFIIYNRRQKRRKVQKKSSAEIHRMQQENRAVLQLCVVVGSFVVGYIPQTALYFYLAFNKVHSHDTYVFRWMFAVVAHTCLRISETLNPILYNLVSKSMREQTVAGLQKIFGCTRIQHPQNVSGRTKPTKTLTTVAM